MLPATPQVEPQLQGGSSEGPDPDRAAAVLPSVSVAVPSAAGDGPRDGPRDAAAVIDGLRRKAAAAIEGLHRDAATAIDGLQRNAATAIEGLQRDAAAAIEGLQRDAATAIEGLQRNAAAGINNLLVLSSEPGSAALESPRPRSIPIVPPFPIASRETRSPALAPPSGVAERPPQLPQALRQSSAGSSHPLGQPAERHRAPKRKADDAAGGSGEPTQGTSTPAPQGGDPPPQCTSGPGFNGLGFVKLVDGVAVTVEAKDVVGPFTYVGNGRRYPTEYVSKEGDISVEEYKWDDQHSQQVGEGMEFDVEAILDTRTFHGKRQYLIKYKGFALDWDDWTDKEDVVGCVLLEPWDRMFRAAND
eukprot:jgi/Botrbrau1/1476/Bobra.178_3s0032.1